ncbi:TetR/AcrR family transcriptional regulator [Planobispora siamensis]|uniref:TetR family transcriptional regulator n=1 Tax=Planobispora siamensis TaxID=936338 RepID=A0A8J3WL27_9ACTN|nr:TetR/AcrR family transcriptional regulator [Planobispora siamensis]GIH93185.1 TetR family transcriptional regulator [Planobispora siamensis]
MSEQTRMPAGRPSKGERTRARILAAAAELFAASGFHAVSLRDIAAHAGLTHAGLLHHFPGKDSLLIEVLDHRDREDAEVLSQVAPREHPEEFLRGVVRVVHRNMRTPGPVGLYARISTEAADPDHPAHAYFVRRYELLRAGLTEAFTALAARTGAPPGHDPALTAQTLVAVMDGLQTQWLLAPAAIDMHAAVVAFFARIGLDFRDVPPLPDRRSGSEPSSASTTSAEADT